MRRVLIILYAVFVHNVIGLSQSPRDWNWVKDASSNSAELGQDIASDTINNWLYTVGYWQGNISATFGGDFTTSVGGRDAFVAKYDLFGNLLWAFPLGSIGADEATGVAVDAAGDIYVTGYYENTIDFQGEIGGGSSVISSGFGDFFIAKYDSDGALIWVQTSTEGTECRGEKVEVNANGVYCTGRYQTGGIFGALTTTTNAGGWDFFVVHYDPTGVEQWIADGGTAGNDRAKGIVVDANRAYVIGQFIGAGFTGIDGTSGAYGTPTIDPAEADIFLAGYDQATGSVDWIHTIGSDDIDLGYDVDIDANGLYATGISNTNTAFPVFGNLGTQNFGDPFISRHNKSDGNCTWAVGEAGSGSSDYGLAIKSNQINTLYVAMQIQGTTNFGGGAQSITTQGVGDIVIAEYNTLTGAFNLATQAGDEDNEYPLGLAIKGDSSVYFTGQFVDDSDYPPLPPSPTLSTSFANFNYVIGNIGPSCDGPIITACQPDVTVTADAACNHILGDYTGGLTVIDDCGTGITVSQDPIAGTVLSAGTYTIEMIAKDGDGLEDTCWFDITIEADVNPTVVQCGDLLIGETTIGEVDNGGPYSCAGGAMPGEDKYYQITVPTGNYLLGVTMTNVADADNAYANVFWVGSSCPLGSSCVVTDTFTIADQDFNSNNQNQLLFSAIGPATYYFVVDSETDGIDSYDIEFDCIVSGVEFDETGCGSDTDNDGIYSTVNGSATTEVEPCQTVSICNTIYVQNVNAGEWMDTVVMDLGPCYTNVTNLIPDAPGPNGFYDAGGTWTGIYTGATNSIEWGFDHSTINLWGDGTGTNYNCRTYTFCFDADISATCLDDDSLKIEILITDDGVDGIIPGVSPGFDYASADDFILVDTIDVGFDYTISNICQNGTNPVPLVDQPGGVFSATAGLVFVSTATGEIDLAASTTGLHTITYTSGFCAEDSIVTLTIDPADVVNTFDYGSGPFCAAGTDPSPNLGAGTTAGGTFSATPAGLSINPVSGDIDLSASTTGIAYTIKYVTPGSCPDSITVVLTVNAEDVVNSFLYTGSPWCAYDADPSPSFGLGTTPGGAFSAVPAGLLINIGTGVIDLDASTAGSYTIKYVTPGPCPDSATFSITINPVDSALFNYSSAVFCLDSSIISPTITGAGGGTFSSNPGGILLNTVSGDITLETPTDPGIYQIIYTTTASTCPHTDSVQLTFNAEDTSNFSYPGSPYCVSWGTALVLEGSNHTTGGIYTSVPPGLTVNPSTGDIDLSTSTAGVYAVKYVSGGLCPDSSLALIEVIQDDDSSLVYSAPYFCKSHAFPVVPTFGTPLGTFSASAGMIINTTTGQIDLGSTPSGSYTVTYTTPGPECPSDSTVLIDIVDEDDPLFIYTPNDTICENAADPVPIPNTPGGTWSEITGGIDIPIPTDGVINMAGSVPGDYMIKYITSGICPDSVELEFRIDSLPNTTFWLPDTVCLPEADIEMNDSTDISGWMTNYFYPGSGSPILSSTDSSIFEFGSTFAATGGGLYEVWHVVTNGACVDSSNLFVELVPGVTAFNLLPDTLCETAGVVNLNGFLDSSTTPGGIWSGTGVFNDSLIFLTGLGGSSYDIDYDVGTGMCADNFSNNVYIGIDADTAWTVPPLMCISSDSVNLADLITGTLGGVFSGSGMTNDTIFDPSVSSAGIFNITYTVGDTGCLETLTQPIEVLPDPFAEAGLDDGACGLVYPLQGTISGTSSLWTTTDGLFIDPTNDTTDVTVNNYGTHWIYLSVDESGVCQATDSVRIDFYEQPSSDAGPDQTLNFTFQTTMDALPPVVGSGIWELTNGGGDLDDELDPISLVENLQPGANHFDWVVTNGVCPEARDQVVIIVEDLFFPQAVTPNNDLKNDYFEIKGIEGHENTVQIFNRWGQLIYETENYQNDWAGTDMAGKTLGDDTYYYIITVLDSYKYTGYIIIKQ